MSKITAMYIRLSMEDEDVSLNRKEESNSISSQRELLKAYIENHSELKDTKVQEYCDDGFTGTKFERPGYMKLMEDIRAEKISCIVVKDLSRLGRDYIEVGSLLEQILPLYQVRVIAVNDNYDSDNYDGSTGGMNVAFKNLIYMLYSRDLSNKICSAKHTRILNGENISGQLRYGYVKDPNDKHKIIVDPEAAEVVKLIFELTAQGKRKTEVANYLNAHGIDTPSAYKKRKGSKNFFHAVEVKSLWSTSSIHDILNDEVYLGKLIWNKTKKRVGSNNTSTYVPKDEWIVIENCHEPIITQKLFDTAHANSKKYIRPKRGKRNYNPFYYCGVCGRALVPSKRVKGDILLCSSSRIEENSPCKSNRVEIAKVENTIMKIVNMYDEFVTSTEYVKKSKQKTFLKLSDAEQKKWFNQKFYEYVFSIEQEKLFYYSLVYNQDTLIISAPDENKEQEKFLGYKWSNRKGQEGIQIIKAGGCLYNSSDRSDNNSIAGLIRNAFSDEDEFDVEDLSDYYYRLRLQDMLDFSGTTFNKSIKTTPTRVLKDIPGLTNYRLADKNFFDLSIGNRVLSDEVVENGSIPIYSANVFEEFGRIDKQNITDFSVPSILWGIDGDWMVNIMPADKPFYPTDHCGVLRIKTDDILPKYMALALQVEGEFERFSRSNRASTQRIANLIIQVPSVSEQQKLVDEIEAIDKRIADEQAIISEQSAKVKSKFVEMFGDNPATTHGKNSVKLSTLCENLDNERNTSDKIECLILPVFLFKKIL